MSTYDPTLNQEAELNLVKLVKEDANSQALIKLVDQYTGIYFNIVNKYASVYPNIIKICDFSDDKMLNMYKWVMEYDPNRNMKLGTYIGNRTDWLCKGTLKNEQYDPLSYSKTGESFATINDNSEVMTIPDTTEVSKVEQKVNKELAIEDIILLANKIHLDPRFIKILQYRNKSVSWRKISKDIGTSYEWCRQEYIKGIKLIKEKFENS